MPKQLWKINQFHGGLNSNADPRDLADNELSFAQDVSVDSHGKIKMLGGVKTHDLVPANAAYITPGYGLFQFSHDRLYGHIGGVEHFNNTSDFSGNWTATEGWSVDATDATYAHNGNTSYLIQTAANRAEEGIANATYEFIYTISGYTGAASTFQIDGSGSQFASANTALSKSNGEHSVTFTSHATDPDKPFTIRTTSVSGGFNIDNVSLKLISAPATGDDYLAMADIGNADVDIYSRASDAWDTSKIDLGSSGPMRTAFYVADGALRVSDGTFGANNQTMWYGYI